MPPLLDLADSDSFQGTRDLVDQLSLFESHICPVSHDSPSDFIASIDSFKDHFYDIHLSLAALPTSTHTFALIFLVGDLSQQLLVLCRSLQRFIHDLPSTESDQLLTQASILLKILLGNLESLILHLLGDPLNILRRFVHCDSKEALNRLFQFLQSTLEIISIDCPPDSSRTLDIVCSILKDGLVLDCSPNDPLSDSNKQQFFSLVVSFLRACYVSGSSSSCEPLIGCPRGSLNAPLLTPEYAIANLTTNSVAYLDLINYFKYVAYTLMTISPTRLTQEDAHKDLEGASICFKILLTLPSLAICNYENELDVQHERNWPRKSVSLVQRLELSLLYIVNTMLLTADLKDILFPSAKLKSELSFLVRSLATILSNELTESVLEPHLLQSREGSILDFGNPPESSNSFGIDNSNHYSLSAVLYHGLYKEKHHLIVEMCDMWSSSTLFSIKKHNEKCHQLLERYGTEHSITGHICGKQKYVECILDISKVLTVLALKKIFINHGLSHVPLLTIRALIVSENTLEVLSGRDSDLSFEITEINDIKHVTFTLNPSSKTPSPPLDVLKMADINDLTHDLRSLTSAL